ncbi:uncharacterized protein TM35_002061000 [Trypanosoma theileri]|uniref:SEA domain-containing protein n=1 Tax=Trypanosoma theileri TaxID=67003 RepID=A0A1X0NDS1_9TRYP|nr:uncharacterized protein TM35_002061000 [Trypanosoma theileri]ORC79560.1 hypothetical protein TM35_002061000 [Trypanosoma theileri]
MTLFSSLLLFIFLLGLTVCVAGESEKGLAITHSAELTATKTYTLTISLPHPHPPEPSSSMSMTATTTLSKEVMPSHTVTLYTPEHGDSSNDNITITPEITPTPQHDWVNVFFEVTNNLTSDALEKSLNEILWKGIQVAMEAYEDAPKPWIRIAFELEKRAQEAFNASNNGRIPGVNSAVYKLPVVPPNNDDSNKTTVVIVVVVIVVVVVLIAVGVLVFLYCRHKKLHSNRFDDDFVMNCATAPVNLNELLLSSFDHELSTNDERIYERQKNLKKA